MAADVNWQASFVALAVLNFAVALAVLTWLPPERASSTRSARSGQAADARLAPRAPTHASDVVHLLKNPQLLATFAIGFCVLFTNVAMFTYVTFHLAAPPFGLSTAALGWLFVVYLVGAVVTPFGGRWIDRYGHRIGLGVAMAIGAAGALLTLAPWLMVVAAGLALCSTGVFIAQSSTNSYIGAVTPRDRALAVGMYSTFYYIGGSAGGAVPAMVWNIGGWTACVALVVIVQMTGVAIAMSVWGRPGSAPTGAAWTEPPPLAAG